jgi:hypothetical protein
MNYEFEILRKQIFYEEDTTLFDEAAKCIKAGAYRMAYIASWIAIAESLKHKFRIMAEKDDIVDKILQQITAMETNTKAPDRIILQKSKEIGIVEEETFPQIETIFQMRNIYAHPYNTGPDKEEAFHALAFATKKVLSIPALFRKPYLDKLMNKLENDRHYIDDIEGKIVNFAKEIIPRILPHLYPYLFKGLIFRIDRCLLDPDKTIILRRLVWFSRTFLATVNPNFSEFKWEFERKYDEFSKSISIVIAVKELWQSVPENIQDRIIGDFISPDAEKEQKKPDPWAIKCIYLLSESGNLNTRQNERFYAAMQAYDSWLISRANIPLSCYVNKLVEDLASSNWPRQNSAAQLLWNLGPESLSDIDDDIKELLGRNILQSAEGDAGQSRYFINKTLRNEIQWPTPFIRGLLFECFINESLVFRCKNRYLYEALIILVRLDKDNCKIVLDAIIDKISKRKEDIDSRALHSNESAEIIDKVINEMGQDKDITGKLIRLREIVLDIYENTQNRF